LPTQYLPLAHAYEFRNMFIVYLVMAAIRIVMLVGLLPVVTRLSPG